MLKIKPLWLTACVASVLVITIIVFYIKTSEKIIILPNGNTLNVAVADNAYKRSVGLMYKKHLEQTDGMLFIFDKPAKYIFWMKNTLIPLDIVWMDENFKIVDITANIQPCTTKSCSRYMPAYPAKYVLEVNAGYSERQNIKIGDTVQLQ